MLATQGNVKDTAGVIAPPPLIALGTLLAGLILDWIFPAYVLAVLLSRGERIFFGLILIAAGCALPVMARTEFRSRKTEINPFRPSTALVTDGIYQWLRNPMYVGLAFLTAGFGIAFASDWTLVLMVPAAIVMHRAVVTREERYLEDKFGAPYRVYMQKVPRYGWPPKGMKTS